LSIEDFWGSDCPGRGHVPLLSLQSLNTIPQCSYLLDPDLNIHSSREKYLGGTIPVSFRQTVPTDMELYLRRYDLSSSMRLLISIEFEIMENREIISKPDQSLEYKLEDLITSVKRSKKRLEKSVLLFEISPKRFDGKIFPNIKKEYLMV